jgi:acylphosphatase
MRTLKILISGMVQGVSYRYFAKRAADNLGVRGWVRNLPDGRVEALAQVPDEDTGKSFIHSLKIGPPHGSVTSVECTPVDDAKIYNSFEITF